jgi:hypothetical protein
MRAGRPRPRRAAYGHAGGTPAPPARRIPLCGRDACALKLKRCSRRSITAPHPVMRAGRLLPRRAASRRAGGTPAPPARRIPSCGRDACSPGALHTVMRASRPRTRRARRAASRRAGGTPAPPARRIPSCGRDARAPGAPHTATCGRASSVEPIGRGVPRPMRSKKSTGVSCYFLPGSWFSLVKNLTIASFTSAGRSS